MIWPYAAWGLIDGPSNVIGSLLQLPIYSGVEIQEFAYLTTAFEDREKYATVTGVFLTHLMKKAQQAGQHDFYLNTVPLKPLDNLCSGMSGSNLRVMIEGGAGEYFARSTTSGTYYVQSAGYDHGFQSYGTTLYVGSGPKRSSIMIGENPTTYFTPSQELYQIINEENKNLTPLRLREHSTKIYLVSEEKWNQHWEKVKNEILKSSK